jgi:hypothetical protein
MSFFGLVDRPKARGSGRVQQKRFCAGLGSGFPCAACRGEMKRASPACRLAGPARSHDRLRSKQLLPDDEDVFRLNWII